MTTLFTGNLFGSTNGPGFGWEDVNVYKLGAAYEIGAWTLRGGYTYVTQPIPQSQTFLNILAPGVVQNHLTLGATWATSKTGELSFNYIHAFEKTVNGSGSIPMSFWRWRSQYHDVPEQSSAWPTAGSSKLISQACALKSPLCKERALFLP